MGASWPSAADYPTVGDCPACYGYDADRDGRLECALCEGSGTEPPRCDVCGDHLETVRAVTRDGSSWAHVDCTEGEESRV
jgi:hypothetical protein